MSTDDLVDRLREAQGPDRELDARIWQLVGDELGISFDNGWDCHSPVKPSVILNRVTMAEALERWPNDISGIARTWCVPRFTGSLDAALMLKPANWSWRVGNLPSGTAFADLGTQRSLQCVEGATPALALCIARLKARAALPDSEG